MGVFSKKEEKPYSPINENPIPKKIECTELRGIKKYNKILLFCMIYSIGEIIYNFILLVYHIESDIKFKDKYTLINKNESTKQAL